MTFVDKQTNKQTYKKPTYRGKLFYLPSFFFVIFVSLIHLKVKMQFPNILKSTMVSNNVEYIWQKTFIKTFWKNDDLEKVNFNINKMYRTDDWQMDDYKFLPSLLYLCQLWEEFSVSNQDACVPRYALSHEKLHEGLCCELWEEKLIFTNQIWFFPIATQIFTMSKNIHLH